jgi:hypothetical protein
MKDVSGYLGIDDIKMGIPETGLEGVNWIHLA